MSGHFGQFVVKERPARHVESSTDARAHLRAASSDLPVLNAHLTCLLAHMHARKRGHVGDGARARDVLGGMFVEDAARWADTPGPLDEESVGKLLGARDMLASLTQADLSNAAFPFGTWREIDLAGAPVRALRVTYVGELGWELHIPVECALAVYEQLIFKQEELCQ